MERLVKSSRSRRHTEGFSLAELMIIVLVGVILTGIAIPTFNTINAGMKLNSMASAISSAISQTRYTAIWKSQVYTLAISVPANTYVVTNVTTNTADSAVPLPSQAISINGGTSATYTFTMCPNGTVYGSGGACPGNTNPPALTVTYLKKQTNISVSGVGNVTTTTIN